MLFENNSHDGIDFSNIKTSTLSEENLNKCIDQVIKWDDEDRRRIEKDNLRQQVSMIHFSEWLYRQDDVSEAIKMISNYLTLGVPVHSEFAKQFDPYIERYNAFLELKKRRRKK